MASNTSLRGDPAALQTLLLTIIHALEDGKAVDIEAYDTEHLTSLFERVVIASGRSNRQTRALANHINKAVRDAGFDKPKIGGEDNAEWITVDCGAVVCHIFQPVIRSYYKLEELWGEKPADLQAQPAKKAASEKAPAKKVPAKKTAAKKAASKKVVSQVLASSAPAKKVAAKKVAAKKAVTKKAPAKKTVAKKAATKKSPGTAS